MSGLENQVKAAMQAVIEHLKGELKSLRTGRASSSMFDKVQIDLHGTHMPIKALGNINVPESRMIVITPFDPSNLNVIAKGIDAANLGVHPIVDGRIVRIPIPPPDETLRKQLAKQCRDFGEKSKIALREVRRKFNELARKQKADGVIAEDVMKRLEKQIQEMTDRFCKEVDSCCTDKEKEILTV